MPTPTLILAKLFRSASMTRDSLPTEQNKHTPVVPLATCACGARMGSNSWPTAQLVETSQASPIPSPSESVCVGLGQQQVVTKTLGQGFGKVHGVSGGAILGDGRVGLILDAAEIVSLSRQGNSRSNRRDEQLRIAA
jgi:hypothetical protein